MKVAVSIPDRTFAEAEQLAREMNTSRSKLYARALDDFLASRAADRVTESWNAVVDEVGDEDSSFVREAARQTLLRSEW